MAQDFISAILGSQPDLSSILSPQQNQQLRTNANLNAAIGAIVPLLGLSGPQMRPVGTGQALGAALGGAFGGYTQGFDRTLQQMLTSMQLGEYARKQKESQQLKDIYKTAITPTYETIPGTQTAVPSEIGPTVVETPETQKITGFNFDINKIIPVLGGMGRFDELKNIQDIQSLFGGSAMKPSDVAGSVKEAVQVLGIKNEKGRLKNPDEFTQDDQTRVNRYINEKQSQLAPKVNFNDPTAVAKAQSENVKDFNTQVKDFREVSRRYNAMVDAHKDKANPATDSTLIYGLAKIYDPAGAVQQGDIATIKGKRSIPENVVGLAERISRGGTLTPQERDNIISTAYSMVNSYSKSVQPDVDTYRSFSKSFGADPNQIRNPFDNLAKPDYIFVTIGGKQQKANKANDGNYYIQIGDQYYKVSN